ncbi:MAG: glycosyltransferase [Planctomycetes bacterium]|nr:glycosyltransferase [Planctomycetota bacterium]
MRILVLCPFVPFPPTHGGRIRSGVMLRALAANWDVHVVTPIDGDAEATAADALARELGVTVERLEPGRDSTSPGAKLRMWVRGRSEVIWRRWSRAAIEQAHRIVVTDPDAIVVVDGTFAAPLLPKRCSSRIVFAPHNVEAEVVARMGASARGAAAIPPRVETRRIAALERSLVRRAAQTIAVSELDRRAFARLVPGAPIRVIENTVDVAGVTPLAPKAPGQAPVLLFVGSFGYPPNREAADELLDRHLPALREAWPDAVVRLVGNDRTGEIARRASGVAGAEAVGFVDDLRDEYAACDAVYIPLRSGGGTRIKVLEAMAFGRPVVATETAVEGLDLERGRHYLSCETPADGVASVRELRGGAAGKVAEVGRSFVEERFDHAVAVADWSEMFEEIGRR